MKKTLIPFLFLLALNSVVAQQKASREDLEKLNEIRGFMKPLTDMKDKMASPLMSHLNPGQQAYVTVEMDRYIQQVKDKMIDFYGRILSQEEVNYVIAYQTSPVGKKLIENDKEVSTIMEDAYNNLKSQLESVVKKATGSSK